MAKKRAAKSAASKTKKSGAAKGRTKSNLTVTLPQFLVDGSDVEFRQFVADLFAAVAGMHSLRRALAAAVGLSAAEYSVLLATWHMQKKKKPVGISAISKYLHVAAAHVTAEVGQLVGKGLLSKTPHPSDTRAVIIELTEDGKDVLAQLTPLLRKINDRLFAGSKPSDVPILQKFVQHLADESRTRSGWRSRSRSICPETFSSSHLLTRAPRNQALA